MAIETAGLVYSAKGEKQEMIVPVSSPEAAKETVKLYGIPDYVITINPSTGDYGRIYRPVTPQSRVAKMADAK